jgi:hypothetical protein
MISLLVLLAFLIIAIFAIKYPRTATKRVVIALNATLVGGLGSKFIWDVTSK